jgi:ABC-type phosphate transport system substrate-binding protein
MANRVTIKAVVVEDNIDFGKLDFNECVKIVSERLKKNELWFETNNKKISVWHRKNKGE